MESSHTVPQVEKKLYKNQTGGWLGVVVLDHNGKETGETIEPHGTLWLSDAEAILTARASRDPKDNPFVEQEFVGLDGNGARQTFTMAPLVLVSDDSRFVPSMDRYVPILNDVNDEEARTLARAAAKDGGPITEAAATRAAEIVREAGEAKGAPQPSETPQVQAGSSSGQGDGRPPAAPASVPQPAPPAGSATPPAAAPSESLQGDDATGSEEQPSWSEPSPQAGQVVPGALQGSDDPLPDPAAETPNPDATSAPMPAQAVATAPGGDPSRQAPEATPEEYAAKAAAEEEHAAAVDPQIGEETGQAKPPTGDAPQGEFAQAEEIGSPDAPNQSENGG